MKDFQIFRYLKQFKYLIAIGSVLAGFMFYYVASNRMQSYTASTVIEYTNTARARDLRRTAARSTPAKSTVRISSPR